MVKKNIKWYCLGIITLISIILSFPSPSPAQGEKMTKESGDIKLFKNPKKPIIAGIPMGGKRAEIMSLFASKNIAPLQRTAPMDIYPRLIGKISYLKKAYLYYTNDRLTKLNILFNVTADDQSQTGEPLFAFYDKIRKKLIDDYGQPTNTTDYVHPNFAYKLVALETGNAYRLDYWENVDDMKVLLSLKGQNGEIDFSLTYQYLYFKSDLLIKAIEGE